MAGVGNISQIEMSLYSNLINFCKDYRKTHELVKLFEHRAKSFVYVPRETIMYIDETFTETDRKMYLVHLIDDRDLLCEGKDIEELIKNW